MVIVISLAAMIGGFATTYALWGNGPLFALALSPVGASLCALLAALALAVLPRNKRNVRQPFKPTEHPQQATAQKS